MQLVIEKSLAQRILNHLASQPTGTAKWSEVFEMVRELEQLKPAAKPEEPADPA